MWWLAACRDQPEPGPPVIPEESAAETGHSGSLPPPPPSPTGLDPALGDVRGGVRVTLLGEGLAGLQTVTLGGEPCAPLTVDAGRTSCVAPALPAGRWDLEVVGPGGAASLAGAWEAWTPASLPGARVYQSDAGLTLDAEPRPGWSWEPLTREAPWHPRDGAGLLWFDGRLWLLGGWYTSGPVPEWGGEPTTNEVWVSDDLGATWSLVAPHDPAPPESGPGARWVARHTAGWLTHSDGGREWMYVVGGDIYHVTGDVWRSADGVTWEAVTLHAPWEGRVLQMVASYGGELYVMGGQVAIYDPATTLRDVWRSSDGGANWTRLPDAPWPARGMVYSPTVFDGRLWVVGGGTYDDGPRTFFADAWAFDGAGWTEVAADGTLPWLPRQYHSVYAAEGALWVASGYGSDGLNHRDVWSSTDGVTWAEAPLPPMRPGHADGAAVTPSGVVRASGNAMDTEVWRQVAARTARVEAWADQGPDGLGLAAPDEASAPRWEEAAFGSLPGVALDGTDALLRLAAWDGHPAGRSVWWAGSAGRREPATSSPNAAMTVVGDSGGGCRSQVGYAGDGLELVVTDALGAWDGGSVTAASGILDDRPHWVGFTQDADSGEVSAWADGAAQGPPVVRAYDRAWQGWDSLGGGFAGGNRAEIVLGAVVVTAGVPSDADRERLATWARKWTDASP